MPGYCLAAVGVRLMTRFSCYGRKLKRVAYWIFARPP